MKSRGHFRRYMMAGIVTLIPLIVTGLFVYWLVGKTDMVTAYLRGQGVPIPDIHGIGLAISLAATVAIIYVVGILTSNFIGRKFLEWSEAIIDKVPIVKSIYTSVKQIADSVSLSQDGLFQKVVMFEYPKEEVWTIGFVTGIAKGEVQMKVPERRLINVFVPTTPNPTSGYLLMVPEENLTPTDLTVEQAMRIIVSGGIAASPADTRLGATMAVAKDDLLEEEAQKKEKDEENAGD
ncbi:DUF502 domain-containing protein [Planctomycetota bacterium]